MKLQLQQGLTCSLFRQTVVHTCWEGFNAKRTVCKRKADLSFKANQLFVRFPQIGEAKHSTSYQVTHLASLLPKKDLKSLPLRVQSFGPLCALRNLKYDIYNPIRFGGRQSNRPA